MKSDSSHEMNSARSRPIEAVHDFPAHPTTSSFRDLVPGTVQLFHGTLVWSICDAIGVLRMSFLMQYFSKVAVT